MVKLKSSKEDFNSEFSFFWGGGGLPHTLYYHHSNKKKYAWIGLHEMSRIQRDQINTQSPLRN